MSWALHEIWDLKGVSACFSKLALNKKYHAKWQTSDQWANLFWAYYQDVLSPVLGEAELNGKILDTMLQKIN
jgi:hypothetical protein